MILGLALVLALVAPHRGVAGEPADIGAVGLLWMPDGAGPAAPTALVVVLHDAAGIDPRAWRYGDQLTAAGIAVLHLELQETSADGYAAAAAGRMPGDARERLGRVLDLVPEDPQFAAPAIGLLAFGTAGQAALLAAADRAAGGRIAAVALLYPGCAALSASLAADAGLPRAPMLLLHGAEDPVNPPAACNRLSAQLARTPVRRIQYPGAGYAWDVAPLGPHEVVKLPWPGRPGRLVAADHWPEVAALSAAQVASFFAAALAPRQPRAAPSQACPNRPIHAGHTNRHCAGASP